MCGYKFEVGEASRAEWGVWLVGVGLEILLVDCGSWYFSGALLMNPIMKKVVH